MPDLSDYTTNENSHKKRNYFIRLLLLLLFLFGGTLIYAKFDFFSEGAETKRSITKNDLPQIANEQKKDLNTKIAYKNGIHNITKFSIVAGKIDINVDYSDKIKEIPKSIEILIINLDSVLKNESPIVLNKCNNALKCEASVDVPKNNIKPASHLKVVSKVTDLNDVVTEDPVTVFYGKDNSNPTGSIENPSANKSVYNRSSINFIDLRASFNDGKGSGVVKILFSIVQPSGISDTVKTCEPIEPSTSIDMCEYRFIIGQNTNLSDGVYTFKASAFDYAGNKIDLVKNFILTSNQELNYKDHAPDSYLLADFSMDIAEGRIPLSIKFRNESTGNFDGFSWDFGDGATSLLRSPVHVFVKPKTGNYQVTLTAKKGSIIKTITKSVLVADSNSKITGGIVKPNNKNTIDDDTVDIETDFKKNGEFTNIKETVISINDDNKKVCKGTGDCKYTLNLNDYGNNVIKIKASAKPFLNGSDKDDTIYIYHGNDENYPTGTILNPSNNQIITKGSLVDFKSSFNDKELGIKDISLKINNNDVKLCNNNSPMQTAYTCNYSWNTTASNYPVGFYTLTATAHDYDDKLAILSIGVSVTDQTEDSDTEPPVSPVNFTGAPRIGEAPLTVTFTDTSPNTTSNWFWSLDSIHGITSFDQNPEYTYFTAGTYNISFTATYGVGQSFTETKSNYIIVTNNTEPILGGIISPAVIYTSLGGSGDPFYFNWTTSFTKVGREDLFSSIKSYFDGTHISDCSNLPVVGSGDFQACTFEVFSDQEPIFSGVSVFEYDAIATSVYGDSAISTHYVFNGTDTEDPRIFFYPNTSDGIDPNLTSQPVYVEATDTFGIGESSGISKIMIYQNDEFLKTCTFAPNEMIENRECGAFVNLVTMTGDDLILTATVYDYAGGKYGDIETSTKTVGPLPNFRVTPRYITYAGGPSDLTFINMSRNIPDDPPITYNWYLEGDLIQSTSSTAPFVYSVSNSCNSKTVRLEVVTNSDTYVSEKSNYIIGTQTSCQ